MTFRIYRITVNCSEYWFSEKIRGGFFTTFDKENLMAYSDLVPIKNRVNKVFISRKANSIGS